MQRIEVRRGTTLSGERWSFWFDDRDASLVLDLYAKFTRPSARHKFVNSETWNRLSHRDTTITTPPLPDDVQQEAIDLFCATVVVKPLKEKL